MRKFIYKYFIFPLGSFLKGRNISRKYAFLKKQEYKNREILSNASFFNLKKIIKYSYQNVPYYHKHWKSINFNPNFDFNEIGDIKKIPILTKIQIRENLSDLISTNFKKRNLIENYTGGSTGEPLIFYNTKLSKDWSTANIFRHYNMCGWDFGDKHAFLWGSERDEPNKKIDQKIRRFKWFNSFLLSEEKLCLITNSLRKFKPKLLIGYPSSVYQLVLFLENNEISLDIPYLQTSAEKIYKFQRDKFKDILNSEVFDRYGCREVGNIAHECSEHDKLHISQELLHVEIIDNDNNLLDNNENGFVTITDFYNYGMPIIRYNNEDYASISDDICSCGRSSYLFNPIIGRTSDNIITPNGKIIHGEFFTHLFYNKPQIEKFQVIQEKIDYLEILIIPNIKFENYNFDALFYELNNELQKLIEFDLMNIEFKIVKNIDLTKSGKYRFTFSKIWQNQLNNHK